MKKVLVFSYTHRHLKKLLPVIIKLRENQNIELHVVIMTSEEKRLAIENNMEFTMLDYFIDEKRNYDFDLGWGLAPLINAIDTIKPDLFIAIEVNYILRNAIRYCRQTKIPSIVIQHGTPNKYSLHAFAPFEGDYFLAWGEFTKEFLINNNVDREKIIVTGGVNFDCTLAIVADRQAIANELGIDKNKKWIIFTTQGKGPGNCPSDEEIFNAITECARASIKLETCELIFQVHPGQKVEDIKEIVNKVNRNIVVVKYKNTEELISASEGVITFFSTTAIDALILKKPLLLINLGEDKEFLPFVNMNAAFGAYSLPEIKIGFNNLINNKHLIEKNIKKAINYINYKNDGKSLDRALEVCYKVLEETSRGENK